MWNKDPICFILDITVSKSKLTKWVGDIDGMVTKKNRVKLTRIISHADLSPMGHGEIKITIENADYRRSAKIILENFL